MAQKTAKSGNVILREIDAPESVDPGQSFDVEIEVSNGALAVNPLDPDICPNLGGYRITVEAEGPDGETRSTTECINTASVGTRDRTFTFTFTAPSATTTATVSANVRLPGSGKSTGSRDTTVAVGSDPATPTPDDDGSQNPFANFDFDGNTPGGGGNPLDPTSGLPSGNAIVAVVGLLALAWLASSAEGVIA